MKNKILITLGVVMMLATFGVSVFNTISISRLSEHHVPGEEGYSYAIDCVREAELEYHRYYYEYVTEVQNYISSVAPTSNLRGYALVEQCEKYGVDVKFVLVQGEIESHYGTKGIGAKLNNVFNVGVFDGLSHSEINSKYRYNYPNESIEPYLKLLTTRYLVNKLEGDLMENYVDVNGKRYASDELYETKFKAKYEAISNTTKIDELQAKVRSYAIKCGR